VTALEAPLASDGILKAKLATGCLRSVSLFGGYSRRVGPTFVDCHSHVVPSGDDGVHTLDQGRALCNEAARRGTRILYATPHVWPQLTLTREREEEIRRAFVDLRPRVDLDLRLGFELTPSRELLREDPRRYALAGTDAVLMEVPFLGPPHDLFALAEHAVRAGLLPVVAHPERTEAVLDDSGLAGELAARGWLLQVNATSLLGNHGPEIEELAWRLVEEGTAALVASDGHRAARPPFLDEAYRAACRRLASRALALFDGSALGLARPAQRLAAAR
jgi:protein-tyrosine phosphatase